MKKIYIFISSIFLIVSLTITSFAANYIDSSKYQYVDLVIDDANLFTSEEEAKLEAIVRPILETYDFSIVLHTTNSIGNKTVVAYADDYYDYTGFTKDGMIFLINMGERDYYTSTTGEAINMYTDRALDNLHNSIVSYLSDGDYYRAFEKYAKTVVAQVSNYYTNGAVATPRPSQMYINIDIKREIIIIAITVTLILVVNKNIKSKYNTAVEKSVAHEYVDPGSFALNGQKDIYVTTITTKAPRRDNDSSSGGGTSTHTSSSGSSHGGGGGKF